MDSSTSRRANAAFSTRCSRWATFWFHRAGSVVRQTAGRCAVWREGPSIRHCRRTRLQWCGHGLRPLPDCRESAHRREMRAVIEDDRVIGSDDEVNALPRLTHKAVAMIQTRAQEKKPFFSLRAAQLSAHADPPHRRMAGPPMAEQGHRASGPHRGSKADGKGRGKTRRPRRCGSTTWKPTAVNAKMSLPTTLTGLPVPTTPNDIEAIELWKSGRPSAFAD